MLFDQALQAMQNRKFTEAEVICRKILAQAPKNFDALHMLAVICSEKGEYDESERLFREALSVDPNFPPGFYNYGSLLAKQKKYLAAITQFDKARRILPRPTATEVLRLKSLAGSTRLSLASLKQ